MASAAQVTTAETADDVDARVDKAKALIAAGTHSQRAAADARGPRAAGAICVLMIILLLMNSVAIWLRNRYVQKW